MELIPFDRTPPPAVMDDTISENDPSNFACHEDYVAHLYGKPPAED